MRNKSVVFTSHLPLDDVARSILITTSYFLRQHKHKKLLKFANKLFLFKKR